MGLRVFHTADVHIGMKFASRGYPAGLRQKLVAERLNVVDRMVQLANQNRCDLFVVAGDLFDSPQVAKRDVRLATELLNGFDGMVLLLPGNHDFLQSGGDPIWDTMRDGAGDRLRVITAPEPLDLRPFGLDAAIYPGPCTAKRSSENAVSWVGSKAKLDGVSCHLGVAHGSLDGLSPDLSGDYYPMSDKELQDKGLDAWLLGHAHVRYPDMDHGRDSLIFSPSTPEPDGFDCRHAGQAWRLDFDETGAVQYQSVPTGVYRFHELECQLSGDGGAADLLTCCENQGQTRRLAWKPECDLVKVTLKGRVKADVFAERHAIVDQLREQVLYLEADLSRLTQEISMERINAEFTEGSFPHRLLSALADEAGETAGAGGSGDLAALQLAYDLIQEARR